MNPVLNVLSGFMHGVSQYGGGRNQIENVRLCRGGPFAWLYRAFVRKSVEGVQKFIDGEDDINRTFLMWDYDTCLMQACRYGFISGANLLLDAGASLCAPENPRSHSAVPAPRDAISIALASRCSDDFILRLLEFYNGPRCADKHDGICGLGGYLIQACASNRPTIALELLRIGASEVSDADGETALMKAVRFCLGVPGDLLVAKLIECAQATGTLDVCNNSGETALLISAKLISHDRFRLLLERGANVCLQAPNQQMLIALLVMPQNTAQLIGGGRQRFDSEERDKELCSLLSLLPIVPGAEDSCEALGIDTLDSMGNTAIQFAIKNHSFCVLRWFLENGAQVHTVPGTRTLMEMVIMNYGKQRTESVRILLAHGFDVNCIGKRGYPALVYALHYAQNTPHCRTLLHVTTMLINAGARVDGFNEGCIQRKDCIMWRGDKRKCRYKDTNLTLHCTFGLLEKTIAWYTRNAWRPWRHASFPVLFRARLRTVVVLSKARVSSDVKGEFEYAYPQAELCCLPEELMQLVFLFIQAPPTRNLWPPEVDLNLTEDQLMRKYDFIKPPPSFSFGI